MKKNYTPPSADESENNEERHYEADFESIQSELKKGRHHPPAGSKGLLRDRR